MVHCTKRIVTEESNLLDCFPVEATLHVPGTCSVVSTTLMSLKMFLLNPQQMADWELAVPVVHFMRSLTNMVLTLLFGALLLQPLGCVFVCVCI